ncbi:MAG: leucine-rich repeat domain-containing protein [Aureispira sp.]
MDVNEKIKQLFYSNKYENRTLAFELAMSQGCYESIIKELYEAWMVYPFFQKMQEYWDMGLGEMQEEERDEPFIVPEGIELTKFYLEELCYDYFHQRINLEARYMPQLETFPLPVLHCTFVQELNLAWNNLKVLPEEIGQLFKLKILDLSHNYELRDLPESMSQLVYLEELSLTGAQAAFAKRTYQHEDADQDVYTNKIPASFRALTNMRKLELGDVILEGFPDWIKEWTQLEEIHTYSGWGSYPFLHLPNSLMQCTQLKTLNIGSYTTIIPESIHQLTQLEHLSVQPALQIPSSIRQLKNLVSLDLSYTASDYPIHLEGYSEKWDLYNQGVPEGISRLKIYGWEWLKEMTWLKQFTYIDIEPYAFTKLEEKELQEALPNCSFVFEE